MIPRLRARRVWLRSRTIVFAVDIGCFVIHIRCLVVCVVVWVGSFSARLPILADYGLLERVGPAPTRRLYVIVPRGRVALNHREQYGDPEVDCDEQQSKLPRGRGFAGFLGVLQDALVGFGAWFRRPNS